MKTRKNEVRIVFPLDEEGVYKGVYYFRFPDDTCSMPLKCKQGGIHFLDLSGDKITDAMFDSLTMQILNSPSIPFAESKDELDRRLFLVALCLNAVGPAIPFKAMTSLRPEQKN
ncbi:MAG: hypothetical protein ACI9AR_000288 [Flavobacteriaceae bacterium]|jgi:hypothetical protein